MSEINAQIMMLMDGFTGKFIGPKLYRECLTGITVAMTIITPTQPIWLVI